MKTLRVLLLVAAFATVTATVASAHGATPRVDRREARQSERIRDGVRSGELTRGETRQLAAAIRAWPAAFELAPRLADSLLG